MKSISGSTEERNCLRDRNMGSNPLGRIELGFSGFSTFSTTFPLCQLYSSQNVEGKKSLFTTFLTLNTLTVSYNVFLKDKTVLIISKYIHVLRKCNGSALNII